MKCGLRFCRINSVSLHHYLDAASHLFATTAWGFDFTLTTWAFCYLNALAISNFKTSVNKRNVTFCTSCVDGHTASIAPISCHSASPSILYIVLIFSVCHKYILAQRPCVSRAFLGRGVPRRGSENYGNYFSANVNSMPLFIGTS